MSKILEKPGVFEIMRIAVIFLLMFVLKGTYTYSQQPYNMCQSALEICPNTVFSINNIGANITLCPGCEDDFNFCFPTDNSIWLTFTTNATGGDVQIDFSNLNFVANPGQDNELQATIIEASVPCNSASYVQLGNCVSNATANFSLNAVGLNANTTYYVVIDGDNTGAGITSPAECSFDLVISGTGVDRPVPAITISATSLSICKDEVVTFIASLADCPDSTGYDWYVNGVLVASTTDPNYQNSALNDGDIITVETDCYSICPTTISVDSPPMSVYTFSVYAGEDVTVSPGDYVTLNGVTTAPVYEWSPGYLFSDPFALSTIVTPTETVTVTLTATENGCVQSDYVTITVTTDLEIPNTFSPNGDLTNDTWEIRGIQLYPNNTLVIYDRWGQKVFQTTGYSEIKFWTGEINGGMVNEGVYYYILDLGVEGTDPINGTVTVIK